MQINILQDSKFYAIALKGDLDAGSSILLDNAIEEAIKLGEKYILINCIELDYIASAGLGVFMSYLQEFDEKKITMVVYGLQNKVLNVFQILGLDQLINIASSEEEAKNLNHDIQV